MPNSPIHATDAKFLVTHRWLAKRKPEEAVLALVEHYRVHGQVPEGVFQLNVDNVCMFPGHLLFELKATHGFPLDFALDKIYSAGMVVEWPSFIETARRNGRWDYQTIVDLEHALVDAGLGRETTKQILDRFKIYVVKYPHPALQDKA